MKIAGILLDNHYSHCAGVIESVWTSLGMDAVLAVYNVKVLTLADVQLPHDIDDRNLWHFCQKRSLLLFTDNRNADEANSLARVIAGESHVTSIPVVTPGNRDRLSHDLDYRRSVFESLAEVIVDIDWYGAHLGVGRVYLPKPRRTP